MSARNLGDGHKTKIALIGVAALVAGLTTALNFQRLPLIAGDTYHAEFTDAAGLQAGEEVRVSGIKVGQVSSIELDGQKVLVTFTVNDVVLNDTTTAGIEVKSLLGQHYLSVTPSGRKELPKGATIPLSRTATPVNLVPAFQELTTRVQALDTEQMAHAFDALSETLEATAPEMTDTLKGLSRLSLTISSRDLQIKRLMARANQVSSVLASRDDELAALLASAEQVLEVLNARRQVITQIINGTVELSKQLSGLVHDNQKAVEGTLRRLDAVLKVLRANRDNIDSTLKYAPVYLHEYLNVGGSGGWFDSTVKLPRGYALCITQSSDPTLASLLSGVLADINHQSTGASTQPCIPLGPTVGGTP